MHYIAFVALLLAMIVLTGAAGYSFYCLLDKDSRPSGLARILPWVQLAAFVLVSLSALILLWALGARDFSFAYVRDYTDSFLPMFYALTAFWAGQDGSFLFWLWCISFLGVIFPLFPTYRTLTDKNQVFFWSFYSLVQLFFLLMLTGPSNPFIQLDPAPGSGNGLNPLLQHPGMIFHPPLLFIGYAGFTIPSCLAFSSWLQGHEFNWMKITRNWLLFAWICLTAGIILGAWWAYMELGWGGYWAWDPVENASLIPWLISTAFMHTAIMGRRQKSLPRFNLLLIALTLVSCFLATFLTRSGVIDSLHAFGGNGVGLPLLWAMFFILLFTVFMVLAGNPGKKSLDGIVGRYGLMLVAAWLFLFLAVIITAGTLWPVLSSPFVSDPVGLDANFYNRVCPPLFVALSLLLFVCPWLKWKQGVSDRLGLGLACAVLGLGAAGSIAWGMRDFWPVLGAASAVAGIFTIVFLFFRQAGLRSSRVHWGIYGVHLGIVIMVLGVSFSGPYSQEKEVILSPGKEVSLAGYDFSYADFKTEQTPAMQKYQTDITVKKDGQEVGMLKPQKRLYRNFDRPFAEVAVIFSLGNELYSTLLGFTEERVASVKLSVNPLVNWVWIGGTIACLLGFLAMDRRFSGSSGNTDD
ncbi:MAG: heme lyase CcmF/NrfE family subunit [Desulfonatronovibrionaceae bacterium]